MISGKNTSKNHLRFGSTARRSSVVMDSNNEQRSTDPQTHFYTVFKSAFSQAQCLQLIGDCGFVSVLVHSFALPNG